LLLYKAYLREILLHLLLVLGGLVFLVTLGAAVQAASRSMGAPLWIPALMVPLAVANTLPYLLPVSLQVAVVLTYGRMAVDGEARAARAAGVRPLRLLLPAVLAGLAVGAITYPFGSMVLPDVYTLFRGLSYRLRFAALENPDPSASEIHYQGLHLLWRERDRRGTFLDVLLVLQPRSGRVVFPGDPGAGSAAGGMVEWEPPEGGVRLRAERARMEVQEGALRFVLEDLRTFDVRPDGSAWAWRNPGTVLLTLPLEGLDRPARIRKADDYRSGELRRLLADMEERLPALAAGGGKDAEIQELRRRRGRFRFALWRRLALAVAAVPLAVAGALLGWKVRRGGVLAAFAISLVVVLGVFFPLLYLGDNLEHTGALDALPAAWVPVGGLLLAVLGLARFGPREV